MCAYVYTVPSLTCIPQIVCGHDHTLYLGYDGSVLSSGWGPDGQLGHGTTATHYRPTAIQSLAGIRQIHASADCCYALDSHGRVLAWGNSEYGQTALGSDTAQVTTPTRASLPDAISGSVVQVQAGGSAGAVLTRGGDVYTVGLGAIGQISASERLVFEKVDFTERINRIYAGNTAMMAVCDDCLNPHHHHLTHDRLEKPGQCMHGDDCGCRVH